MGYENQIIENAAAIQKILSESKNIGQLNPLDSSVVGELKIAIYKDDISKSYQTSLSTLLEFFVNSVGYMYSNKIDIVFKKDQTVYNIPSKPDNIDLYRKGQWQVEKPNYDCIYDSLTGNLTIYNSNNADTDYQYRSYGKFSTKQEITVGADNQSVFSFSGSPANIDVYYEGQLLLDSDFDRTKFSEGNSLIITNPLIIDSIRAGKTLEIRKF